MINIIEVLIYIYIYILQVYVLDIEREVSYESVACCIPINILFIYIIRLCLYHYFHNLEW